MTILFSAFGCHWCFDNSSQFFSMSLHLPWQAPDLTLFSVSNTKSVCLSFSASLALYLPPFLFLSLLVLVFVHGCFLFCSHCVKGFAEVTRSPRRWSSRWSSLATSSKFLPCWGRKEELSVLCLCWYPSCCFLLIPSFLVYFVKSHCYLPCSTVSKEEGSQWLDCSVLACFSTNLERREWDGEFPACVVFLACCSLWETMNAPPFQRKKEDLQSGKELHSFGHLVSFPVITLQIFLTVCCVLVVQSILRSLWQTCVCLCLSGSWRQAACALHWHNLRSFGTFNAKTAQTVLFHMNVGVCVC